jgi:hypothetical protein
MLIYRVENPSKRGPYASWAMLDYDQGTQPAPYDDGLKTVEPREFFGFKSLEQLTEWFSERNREYLHNAGFRVRVYKCPDHVVRHGNRQIVFPMFDSEVSEIRSLHLLTFVPIEVS